MAVQSRNGGRPDEPVVVVGAGLAGLAAAMRLQGHPVLVVERDDAVGGKARSRERDGYTFDLTGHWLHLREPDLRDLVFGLLGEESLNRLARRATVWLDGRVITYPFQANINGLPLGARVRCLGSYLAARLRGGNGDPAQMRFEDFIVERFGRGMARHFFIPYYSKKFHGIALDELRTEWLKDYFPMPTTAQVIRGAFGRDHRIGYNSRFLYPERGGIGVLPEAMLKACAGRAGFELRLETSLEEIDLAGRRLRLSDSPRWRRWGAIISTMPLADLLDSVTVLPEEIRDARRALRSSAMRYADVALRAPSPIREHWVYTPGPEIPFYRMGVYTNAAPLMAPPGGASLWVEIAGQAGPVADSEIIEALVRIGAVAAPEDVLFVDQHKVEHAYVVFDDAREKAIGTILPWLAGQGIHSCGRYGRWGYGSMGDAINDGFSAAALVAGAADGV
ncbi:protoporphyrinogen/coproporphyrinogen oxidase [Actinomadura sp. 9N215]|uniref:protoporphyrinogen/coproporphyrinogen oxidase n=1 Tax=Actinomadura sp. 9N215 TaxID=3375150 RepID=UPI0037A2D712